MLLQISLGQVLEVPFREGDAGADCNLGSVFGDLDLLTELAQLAVDFDPLAQVLGEVGGDEHFIADGLGAVDGKIEAEGLLLVLGAGCCLSHYRCGNI